LKRAITILLNRITNEKKEAKIIEKKKDFPRKNFPSELSWENEIEQRSELLLADYASIYDSVKFKFLDISEIIESQILPEYYNVEHIMDYITNLECLLNEIDSLLKITVSTSSRNSLEDEKIRLQDIKDKMYTHRWVVRIVLCDMNYRPFSFCSSLGEVIEFGKKRILSGLSEYGLVHLAIQIGPYLFDWLNTSELRIRRLTSATAMLFLYPCSEIDSSISIENKIQDIALFLINWRTLPYNVLDRNCQTFVNEVLKVLDIQKTWIKQSNNTPIRDFLNTIEKCGSYFENYELNFYGIKVTITNHSDLLDYYNSSIFPLLKDEVDVLVIKEIVDIIRGLERGFMSQNNNDLDCIDFSEITKIKKPTGNITTLIADDWTGGKTVDIICD